ncbi:MAG: hypothetical protein M1835_001266 [Candelina submexicana]|nr:MAG: hypothetical protein M1835_001266 [Candelina submexicana]
MEDFQNISPLVDTNGTFTVGDIESMKLEDKLEALHKYSACDVSDALVKLGYIHGGFLADIFPRAPYVELYPEVAQEQKVIAPASTVLFVPKEYEPLMDDSATETAQSNIPVGSHYADLTEKGTIVVISQPEGQKCAVLGGIMARRMKVLGAKGVVVDGRVRDLAELRCIDLPVWSRRTSTVGAAAEAEPYAINVAVKVGDVVVEPGDVIFAHAFEGIVSIPFKELDGVLTLLPKLAAADYKVKIDVRDGSTVKEAFAKHRQGL